MLGLFIFILIFVFDYLLMCEKFLVKMNGFINIFYKIYRGLLR